MPFTLRALARVRSGLIRPNHVPIITIRSLLTLAIETSCDDTSVAILEKHASKLENGPAATLHFHEKVTSNNVAYRGVHPVVSLESHQENLALLINKAVHYLPEKTNQESDLAKTVYTSNGLRARQKPDFISVTRGPGMRSNVAVGLENAKALSVAWQIPMVGIHHMQAHALTPRLVTALSSNPDDCRPQFPFLSLLVSGGHTLLLHSSSLTDYRTLATTVDVALGNCIDKVARFILPARILTSPSVKSTMYGPILERFAFPCSSNPSYDYQAPATRHEEFSRRTTKWPWSFSTPLSQTRGGQRSRDLDFTFTGLESAVERAIGYGSDSWAERTVTEPRDPEQIPDEERQEMAKEVMRVAFEHLASRVVLALDDLARTRRLEDAAAAPDSPISDIDERHSLPVNTLVVSGGVAANKFLRYVLRAFLDARCYDDIELVFPPLELCTDNAAMIAWAGVEMWEAGYRSPLSVRARRRWGMDGEDEDGGILSTGEGGGYLRV
ncbi:hypothetical protein M501DRAFT_1017604 [Patellaria atrata CBS 101060]|uniref:Gcp-like domain-containing protein n=1 Tax=Patellaria atrata CBS 101060 TaxID=1346257 RepID=A0A9P4S884_9PEZI|nr:hypothetical protein M501DRAFT_1017604 [Patellaria atrata CBS 101060]